MRESKQDVIEKFRSISMACTSELSRTSNAPDLIPYGKELISLISAHSELRPEFCDEFLIGIKQPEKLDPWLIEFCMHILQWPELKAEFEDLSKEAIANNNWNLGQSLRHVLAAFEDNWEDKFDVYAEYFKLVPHNHHKKLNE